MMDHPSTQPGDTLLHILSRYYNAIDLLVLIRPSQRDSTQQLYLASQSETFPDYLGVTHYADLQTAPSSPLNESQHENLQKHAHAHRVDAHQSFVHTHDSDRRRSKKFIVPLLSRFVLLRLRARNIVALGPVQQVAELER